MANGRCVKALVCVAVMAVSLTVVGYTDEEIKDRLIGSGQYIDNYTLARAAFQHSRGCCEGDTNRFARLIFELAQTNDTRMVGRMIGLLGTYGTTAQLPFLYSMATNEQHGASAVKSILRLEGVTSNSVAIAGTYLSMTNITQRDRSAVCDIFFKAVKTSNVPDALKQEGENVTLRYAGTANLYFRRMDEAMIRTEPSYRQSRRRLVVLRSVHSLGVSPYQLAYVTNAINELVAYPEADLPE